MQRRPQMSRRPSVGGRNPRNVQVKQQPRIVRQAPKKRPARKPGS
jgi:hypothetical protein